MTTVIGMAFRRREQALHEIARIKAGCLQTYLLHHVWDWNEGTGRSKSGQDFLKHTDEVLDELVGIGNELSRFLQLPNYSMPHHRVMHSGRQEAVAITEVAYLLLDSVCTKRIPRLAELTEHLKCLGVTTSEMSRARQFEFYIVEAIEKLRQFKTYRTPLALRAFGRIFTVIIPPFYAPSFAQLAINQNSLAVGIIFALLTPLCLTALLESLQALEDPFVGRVGLDGIDVDEEFEILQYQQLINVRMRYFPDASPFVPTRSEEEESMIEDDDDGACSDVEECAPPKREDMIRKAVKFSKAIHTLTIHSDDNVESKEEATTRTRKAVLFPIKQTNSKITKDRSNDGSL